MFQYIKSLRPQRTPEYLAAWQLLADSDEVTIAQLDSGLAPHRGIGWTDRDAPPPNLLISRGRNLFDPDAAGEAPLMPMRRPIGLSGLIEYPDHGTKTLSALLGPGPELEGVIPGAHVVPYRVANGPLFRAAKGPAMKRRATEALGEAIDHALGLTPRPSVMTVSMGNPGFAGVFEPVRLLLGGDVGIARSTARAIDRAYEAGVIMVCAAGQVIETMVYPAKFARTIAVSGFDLRGSEHFHYPRAGYIEGDWMTLVDVWARAMRINRASFDFTGPTPRPVFAETDPEGGEPSGTSYATPQVAGAAALWVARWKPKLEELFGAEGERWKIVESFRHALRESAAEVPTLLSGARSDLPAPKIRALDIPNLLKDKFEPRRDWPLTKRPAAADVPGGLLF